MIGASMRVFADRVSWELKDDSIVERLHVQRMSEFMKAPEGSSTVSREMYGLLRRHNGRLRTLFAMLPREGMTRYFRPFCEDCERGPRFDRQFISSPDSLSTHCPEHGTYSVEPAKQTNWTMYYQIDPLRDVLLSDNRQRRVLHVFGGDYGVREGMHSSKADKLSVMTQFLSPDTIDHFVGPLLTKEGQKMSKSTGHRTNIPDINVLDELARSGKGSIPMDNAA